MKTQHYVVHKHIKLTAGKRVPFKIIYLTDQKCMGLRLSVTYFTDKAISFSNSGRSEPDRDPLVAS